MNENVGFYPTTQLNPDTTTIGSQGTFQSIMSYIYGASSYKFMASALPTSTLATSTYTGLAVTFTPTNSQNALILYNIYSDNSVATVNLTMGLYIDTNPPPAQWSAPPATAIQLDQGTLDLGVYRSQTLILANGLIWGGFNSQTSFTLNLNIEYYLTWYMASVTAGSTAGLHILGCSIQSI